MLNIGVLVSGGGSNLQAIIDDCENGEIKGNIKVVISNKEDAFGLERARKHNIRAVFEKNEDKVIKILKEENIFVMDENRALAQQIRPLQLLILNIMPTKVVTETQLLRMLSNTPLQIEVDWIHMASHESKNTPQEHLLSFISSNVL